MSSGVVPGTGFAYILRASGADLVVVVVFWNGDSWWRFDGN
ncbi:hypothetical protein HanXRQr2_Chr17g0779991 [Helianthus annuus]|uniref:Uncharacterized protein n=1 Tax=Helianthus annuus TaxID=4232 RepID=A0A9K3DEZ4_HELAN|nr:hypothetical protein HanXRQr2_Chr17g0779991 [Helianthus annuus]KAJ0811223.1 hypothetical protein HanPSC8_Chr17g0748371 [Helianthus annuus]